MLPLQNIALTSCVFLTFLNLLIITYNHQPSHASHKKKNNFLKTKKKNFVKQRPEILLIAQNLNILYRGLPNSTFLRREFSSFIYLEGASHKPFGGKAYNTWKLKPSETYLNNMVANVKPRLLNRHCIFVKFQSQSVTKGYIRNVNIRIQA